MAAHAGIPAGVHVLLERDGKLLLMRRAGTGFFDGLFSLPGGHIEAGESLRDAGARELAEELGIHVEAADLDYLGVVHRLSDTNRIDFFLRATRWAGEPTIREPDKCDALMWHPHKDLPGNTVPYVCEALAQSPAPWAIETGWV